ncbi:hypothetical protein RJT34_23616 [Clitoria ternatea]|uniref:RING-type domain-containing protein n=1 Tax=Clitoria ternatea TaxID=43366 RepID=A0AAN9FN03_CLITE
MNNNNSTIVSNKNEGFDASGFTYGVAFVIGLIFLLLSLAFACIRLRISLGPNMFNILAGSRPSRGEDTEQGLHHQHNRGGLMINTSFERYPKLLYSQVEKNNKDGSSIISSCCSICLGDYKETDMLRLLPDCGHLFHLACVDPWLRLHSTCPICRKSPVSTSSN